MGSRADGFTRRGVFGGVDCGGEMGLRDTRGSCILYINEFND